MVTVVVLKELDAGDLLLRFKADDASQGDCTVLGILVFRYCSEIRCYLQNSSHLHVVIFFPFFVCSIVFFFPSEI